MNALWELVKYDIAPNVWSGLKFWAAAALVIAVFVILLGVAREHTDLVLVLLGIPGALGFLWLSGKLLKYNDSSEIM